MVTFLEMAEQMKREIVEDIESGVVPNTVADFAELHDYVDANCYGGSEALLDELDDGSETDEGRQAVLDALWAVMNPAMEIINAWIKSGAVRNIAPKETQPTVRIAGGGVDQARQDYNRVLLKAQNCIQRNLIAPAHDLLYEAEQVAYDAGLFDEAARCRTAQTELRAGRVPAMFTPEIE